MSKQYSYEEVVANLNAAKEQIKPAVLAETPTSGLRVSAYIKENNLEPTTENLVRAINALVRELPWTIKPAKLLAIEANERQIKVTSPQQSENDFVEKVRAGEAADAHKKAQDTAEKSARLAIDAFAPLDRTGRFIDGRKQQDTQKLLRDYLDQQRQNGVDMVSAKAKVVEYIEKAYRKVDEGRERL